MRSRISSTAVPHSPTPLPLLLTGLASLIAALGLPSAALAQAQSQTPRPPAEQQTPAEQQSSTGQQDGAETAAPQPIVVTGALPKNRNASAAPSPSEIEAPNQRIDLSDPIDGELESVVFDTALQTHRSVLSESPIDILSARELHSTGATDLASVLARLLPLFNFPRPSGAGGSAAVRPLQLHGLAPDQTLVLINGKRQHAAAVLNTDAAQGRGAAPVDLNAIPLAAIDHVEVLRDGAAALYGSDAIAGVVNIVLKKGAAGGYAEAGFGAYQKNDGKQKNLAGTVGVALGQDGWLRLSAQVANNDATNRADAAPGNPGQGIARYGDPDSKPRSLFANSAYRINDLVEWYGYANYGERNTSAAAAWRGAAEAGAPAGVLPLQNSKSTDQSVVTGLRGQARGWNWDASVNYGSNRFGIDLDDTINAALGAASPSHFDAGQLKNTSTLGNFDLNRDFALPWFSGPLTLAMGAELRDDRYQIGAGDVASYTGAGALGYRGYSPADAGSHSRRGDAVYLNLEAEISKRLSATLGARHERYDGYAGNTSATASARYEVSDAFSLRGTASTGARPPSLAQQFYSGIGNDAGYADGLAVAQASAVLPVDSAAARALGAQPLKAEHAHKLNLGMQFQPAPSFSAALDAYLINIDDRILLSSNLALTPAQQAMLAAQGRQAVAARYFSNAADTRTSGVDLSGTYRAAFQQQQRLEMTLAYNHNQTSLRRVATNPALLGASGAVLFDRQTLLNSTAGTPRDKLSLASDYTMGNWNGHALLTRYGAFTVAQNDAALDQVYGAQWVLDLAASVRLGQHWRLTAGIDNANNRYPDRVTALGQLGNGDATPYSAFSPNGFNGRYYYAKAAYAW